MITFITKDDSPIPLFLSLLTLEDIYGLLAIKGEELIYVIPSLSALLKTIMYVDLVL